MPHIPFYGGRKQATAKFYFSFNFELEYGSVEFGSKRSSLAFLKVNELA